VTGGRRVDSSRPDDDPGVRPAGSSGKAVVFALTYAGHTWGIGRWWAALPFVRKNRRLI
jgi:thiosulfate dehydrogenase [quinone] large subunit